jgi:hypothetical protein
MNIDRKKAAILLTAVAVVAIMSGIALSVHAANNGEESGDCCAQWINNRMMQRMTSGTNGWSQRRLREWPHGGGCNGFIEVSEEFKENVINVAKNDSDVQDLLDDGYNITGVRPIIKAVVEGDGSVVTKATSAIVMLEKDTIGRATLWVNLEEARVTKIVILTRTVIEK